MTQLAILRHAPTEWSAQGRLQGRADRPLSAAGRAALAGRRIPDAFARWTCLSSPLARCTETARLLGLHAQIEQRLIEMDWGAWEGRTLAELRASDPGFAAQEALGIDLAPPGGESPRAVQQRLLPFLRQRALYGRDTLAIAHKGVVRALLSLALSWDMRHKPPVRLDWSCLHLFALAADGQPRLAHANIALERA